MLEIVAVPAFTDNYIWLVHDQDSGETAVVDPGDAAPALAEAERRGWPITQVWNTHWHPDHTGGNLAIKAATGAPVSGPAAEDHPGRDVALSEGSCAAHRRPRRPGDRDTRPYAGPRRFGLRRRSHRVRRRHLVRDGLRPAVRRHGGADVRLAPADRGACRPDTALYCGHEYTLANALFAAHAEPGQSH